MKLSGFTDEVSVDLDKQIQITKELGWKYLSARTIGHANIHEISEVEFNYVVEKLESNDIRVAEFGTLIGNWAKNIQSDWSITVGEINRCIPRMQRLGVQYARIMSYAQEPWGSDQYEQERFKRLREIVSRFSDAGLMALHENCMNWGGFSYEHTLKLLDEVPGLKLVFDTGNPVFQRDRSKSIPYPWQDAYEFFQNVKHAVVHVHIKDGIMHSEEGEPEYTHAGEGNAMLDSIMKVLKDSNFNGFIAIEPHMGSVFHLKEKGEYISEKNKYQIYKEYAEKFQQRYFL